MNETTVTDRSIIPSFRYHDATAAIASLGDAFGFARHAVYDSPGGTIAHAQLTLGSHFIMLGSATNDRRGWPDKTPREVGGVVDAHHARTRAVGTTIVDEPSSPEHGGRSYGVADCEGYLWCFGSYRRDA